METPQVRKPRPMLVTSLNADSPRSSTPFASQSSRHKLSGTSKKSSRQSTPALQSQDTPGEAQSAPAPAELSIFDFTYEEYKAANLNISQQYDLIGQVRQQIPVADRDDIDCHLLSKLAMQLEVAIFPTCKMMQVDPQAVKSMLLEQFYKAYPDEERAPVRVEVAAEVDHEMEDVQITGVQKVLNDAKAFVMNGGFPIKAEPCDDISSLYGERSRQGTEPLPPAGAAQPVHPLEPPMKKLKIVQPSAVRAESEEAKAYFGHFQLGTEPIPPAEPFIQARPLEPDGDRLSVRHTRSRSRTEATPPAEPLLRVRPRRPVKKIQSSELSAVQKEVEAYQAKRKRARKGRCLVVTLKSDAVAAKWEQLEGEM
ncbi:hypothetical protein CC86DRAFT_419419 [Ophiobolus disseminans]|uniref:Uncharacterized protein n=1 Tax=Ophiobolus disseminans TaxID=1469910 RepID=A0A6A6ZWJ6_9PLEO|nr:hypothetical protein CC86DRAFT_419419 [Ophiobolus disseminans]